MKDLQLSMILTSIHDFICTPKKVKSFTSVSATTIQLIISYQKIYFLLLLSAKCSIYLGLL